MNMILGAPFMRELSSSTHDECVIRVF